MKEDEKLKVGRPKLADDVTKAKALSFVAIAIAITSVFVVIGTSVMFGDFNTKKLKGASCGYEQIKVEISGRLEREECKAEGGKVGNGYCLMTVPKKCPSSSGSSSSGGSSYSSGGSSYSYTPPTTTKAPIKSMVSMSFFTGRLFVGETSPEFRVSSTTNIKVNVKSSDPNGIEVQKLGDQTIKGNKWKLKYKKAGTYKIYVYDDNTNKKVLDYTYTVYKEPTQWSFGSVRPGDVNGDRLVNQKDVELIRNHSAKLATIDSKYVKNADVDEDGKITATDSRIVGNAIRQQMDVNGDKKVNSTDYLILLRILGKKYGDVNGDNKVNARDVKLILEHSAKKSSIDSKYVKRADLDGDGKYYSKDARIAQIYATNFYNQIIKLGVSHDQGRQKMKVGSQTDKFSVSVSDDTKSIWVSTYEYNSAWQLNKTANDGLQVMKYGDNSKSKNSWSLKAKKPGRYILGVTTDTGVTFKISYNVVK